MLLSRAFLALTWVATAAQAFPTTGDGKTDPEVGPSLVDAGQQQLPDISNDVNKLITANLDGLDCTAALQTLNNSTRTPTEIIHKRRIGTPAAINPLPVPAAKPRDVTKSQDLTDCDQARKLLLAKYVPPGCEKINNIQLAVLFSDSSGAGTYDNFSATLEGPSGRYGGGTWDTLELVIGNGTGIKIADAPAVGRYKAEVSLSESFGQETIDIRSLGKLQIMTKNATNSGAGDDWAMDGIVLSGVCADSSVKMWMSKYVDVGSWFSHVESGPAWSGAFDFLDWSRKGPNPAWGL
ncbi:hypothetical protein V2A60_004200 [Cordyceps javanica]